MRPEICPNCGAAVPPKAKACPVCGSDEETGWSEEAQAQGLDLPNQEFDYEGFVKEEFGQQTPVPRGMHWFWWVVAVGLLIGFALFFFRL